MRNSRRFALERDRRRHGRRAAHPAQQGAGRARRRRGGKSGRAGRGALRGARGEGDRGRAEALCLGRYVLD